LRGSKQSRFGNELRSMQGRAGATSCLPYHWVDDEVAHS
jgi:hypothetical protein